MRALAGGLLLVLGLQSQGKPPIDWDVTGVWSDACACDSFCPCWFNSPATHGMCNSVSFFMVEKGRYGSTPLDGLRVVEALSAPSGMTMIETSVRGKLKFNRFYVDSRANPAQRAGLENILKLAFGAQEFQPLAIAADVAPLRHKVAIEKVLDYEVVLLAGLDGKNPVKLLNAPFTDRSIPELMAGRSVLVRYTDGGERWEFRKRHATFARFHMTRAMYAQPESSPTPPPK